MRAQRRSDALRGDNCAEVISASPHFKQQNGNYSLIVRLKAFPQEGHWFPKCDLLAEIGNVMNKQPDFGALSSRARASHSSSTCITIIATWGPINPLIDWLIAQNPSTVPQWPTGVALGIVGFVSTFPHAVSFIRLFLLLFHGAWSMRLDLQCNGIKRIVSHLWARRTEPIKPLRLPRLESWSKAAHAARKNCVFLAFLLSWPPPPQKKFTPLGF